jgi:electron transfer flavoprotein beta subunit
MNIKCIAVLVSTGRHPTSGVPRHCRDDSLALTIGIDLSQTKATKLEVLHAGNANNSALMDYLALGADQINVIPTEPNTDIVESIAERLVDTDLILTGSRAENGQNSGLLPYLLAEKLNIPIVSNVLEIRNIGDKLEVLQFFPKGKRRRVTVNLPAVIAIHPLAPVELRYAYVRQQQGKIIALTKPTNVAVESHLQWDVAPKLRKPIKLKAPENLTGHERLLAAITSENKGGTVVNDGNCVEKAQVILSYLREHQLITF